MIVLSVLLIQTNYNFINCIMKADMDKATSLFYIRKKLLLIIYMNTVILVSMFMLRNVSN